MQKELGIDPSKPLADVMAGLKPANQPRPAETIAVKSPADIAAAMEKLAALPEPQASAPSPAPSDAPKIFRVNCYVKKRKRSLIAELADDAATIAGWGLVLFFGSALAVLGGLTAVNVAGSWDHGLVICLPAFDWTINRPQDHPMIMQGDDPIGQ